MVGGVLDEKRGRKGWKMAIRVKKCGLGIRGWLLF